MWFIPRRVQDQIENVHHNDVIMGVIPTQITSITIVYSTGYSDTDLKKTSQLRVTGLCAGNSPGTGEFPAQMASNTENVSIWWRHHVYYHCYCMKSFVYSFWHNLFTLLQLVSSNGRSLTWVIEAIQYPPYCILLPWILRFDWKVS